MSEFRQDPVTGVWTLVAPARAGRPKDFLRAPEESADPEHCPFCAGHEHMTPPTEYEGRVPGVDGWVTRVVANKFPALTAPDDSMGPEDVPAPEPYRGMTGFGGHEVIIETPRHGEGLADYDDAHARALVDTLVERVRYWHCDGRVSHVVIFRNWGRKAGASLAHAHMQLAALPRIPDAVGREAANFLSYAEKTGGRCVLCAAIAADDDGGRTVYDDGVTLVQSPWAAPIPYALRLAQRAHSPSILDLSGAERESLAVAMVTTARVLREAFGDPAFNIVVHIAPFRLTEILAAPYHWHMQFILRTSDQAGFEWGTGQYLNVIDPDAAAAELRESFATHRRIRLSAPPRV
jgi:UDPglucose--hexose-1-phosphate uridylyltransferase